MTREEAIKEIEKVFEPAFANYIVEALTKGATVSDCISREQAIEEADKLCLETSYDNEKVEEMLRDLPSVTPQEPKIIPIAEIKCDEGKLKSMVEIDLYSVIKQKYIEREVLDKIRAEVKALSPEPTAYDVIDGNPIKDTVWEILALVLEIIDKYRAESEGKK